MLHVPIRYINNGEPLDQVTLNRYMYDVQQNLEALFASLGGSAISGEVDEIPNSLVKRDAHGTTQFAAPRVGTNPLRRNDVVNSLTNNSTANPLSANMGAVLKGMIDSVSTNVGSLQSDVDGLSNTSSSTGANGYYTLPGGITLQWMRTTSVGRESRYVAFPKPFTTRRLTVQVTKKEGSTYIEGTMVLAPTDSWSDLNGVRIGHYYTGDSKGTFRTAPEVYIFAIGI